MRGPGTGLGGRDIARRDKPCPAPYAEWLFCKTVDFALLPGDLKPGEPMDEQPADSVWMWQDLASTAASHEERIRSQMAKKRGRGR